MPATTSTKTKALTTNTPKSESQTIKSEILNSDVFQTGRLTAIESRALEGDQAEVITAIEQKLSSETAQPTSTEQDNTETPQTPLQKMVQSAQQWRNCSKPHRI